MKLIFCIFNLMSVNTVNMGKWCLILGDTITRRIVLTDIIVVIIAGVLGTVAVGCNG